MISQASELRSLVEHLRVHLCLGHRPVKEISDSASHGWKFIVIGSKWRRGVDFTDNEEKATSFLSRHDSVIKIKHPISVPVDSEHWYVLAWPKRTHKKYRRDFVVMFKRKDV